MKEWHLKVIEMTDIEPHNKKHIDKICQDVFRYLSTKKLKDPHKFKEKYGLEYETFTEELCSKHSKDLVETILNYDNFMDLTHEHTRKYKK